MNQNQTEYKEFLQQQLQWTKEQASILDEMDRKLLAMKKIAERAAENKLSREEHFTLNEQLEQLKKEFDSLEVLRKDFIH